MNWINRKWKEYKYNTVASALRKYKVLEATVPSMLRGLINCQPKLGAVTAISVEKGYLTIIPLEIKTDGDILIVKGKYSKITIKRIK